MEKVGKWSASGKITTKKKLRQEFFTTLDLKGKVREWLPVPRERTPQGQAAR